MLSDAGFAVSFDAYSRRLREFLALSPEAIAEYQARRLDLVVAHARRRSPFYRHLYRDIQRKSGVHLEELPIIDKQALAERFDSMVTSRDLTRADLAEYFRSPFRFSRRFRDQYLAFHTSGSTGHPVYVLWGPREFGIAAGMLALQNIGLVDPGTPSRPAPRKRFSYIGIMDDYVGGNSWVHALGDVATLQMLSIFSPIERLCEALDRFQPQILMAKPHKLGDLARAQDVGLLDIHPERIIFVGEMMAPRDEQAICQHFQVVPWNSYSTCETGPVAKQAEDAKSLDVLGEEVIVEIVDDRGEPIREYGRSGRLLITSLYNELLPIIRYDIGDTACFEPGGRWLFSRISYIHGRETSRFVFDDGEGRPVSISEFPFWSLDVPGVARYQVIQTSRAGVEVRIEWERGFEDRARAAEGVRKKAERIFREHRGLAHVSVTLESVPRIEPNRAGKIRVTLPLPPLVEGCTK